MRVYKTNCFYLYWSNFAYFIQSWGLLSYDSIIFWTSSTLMESLSKMVCRILIRSSRDSGFTTSVCSMSMPRFSMVTLNIFLQAKQLTCPSNFAQTFTFIGHWHNLGVRGGGLYHYAKGWTPTVLRPIGINVKLIKIIIRIRFIWSSSHLGLRYCATFSCNYCVSSITHMGVAHEGGLILFQSNSTTLSHTSSPFLLPFS